MKSRSSCSLSKEECAVKLVTVALQSFTNQRLEKVQAVLPAGMTLMEFGLPGDRAVDEEGIEFLLWAEA